MFQLLIKLASSLFYLALHVTNPGSFPPALTSREEALLLEKMAAGDTSAKNKLIEHNLRLVAHVMKKFDTGYFEQEDLISIGTIGLIKAVSTFKPEKGSRLATYAARCIENEILMYFRSTKKSANDLHFSDPIDTDKDGNALTLMDVVADDINIVDDIDKKMKIKRMLVLLESVLDDREREIIRLRYGLSGQDEMTQRVVASILGISRSYVSRIEKSALAKLRRML